MFPSRSVHLVGFMTDLGYDPSDTSVDTTTPRGSATWPPGPCWTSAHDDGVNQLGDRNGGAPHSDWTGYTPVNTWDQVNDPYHWQPLCVPTPPPGATQLRGDRPAVRHAQRVSTWSPAATPSSSPCR